MRRLLSFLILFSFLNNAQSQIVNIEKRRMRFDTTGWFGTVNFSLIAEQNSRRLITWRNGSQIEYQTPKRNYLMLHDFRLVQGDDQTFVNSGFLHFRFTQKIDSIHLDTNKHYYTGNFLRWESFIQIQYNQLLGINFRTLIGTGFRFVMFYKKDLNLFTGITPVMLEYEEEINGVINRAVRFSSYISFYWKLNENLSVSSTTYYQPWWTKAYDYRIASEISLFTNISKRFSWRSDLNLIYDTNPPPGIRRTAYNLNNGILFKF